MSKYSKLLAIIIVILIVVSGSLIWLNWKKITPTEDFFELSIGPVPEIDGSTWELEISGAVENPTFYTLEDIMAMPKTVQPSTLKCVEGPFGTAEWGGVQLNYILDQVELLNSTGDVIFYAVDDFSSSLTIEDATDGDVLLAYEMNGEPLPEGQGYPLRLVVPGKYGYKWVKWISEIRVVDYDHKGFWESRGWSDDASITTFNYWGVHAVLLTIATVFCGLACISGFKFTREENFWTDLPPFFTRRFHRLVSITYIAIILPVFSYWIYVTYMNRGAVFYSGHGVIGLFVMILTILSGISGIFMRRNPRKFQSIHMTVSVLCFFLLVGTIVFGLIKITGTF